MKNLLLVHGAWHTERAWDKAKALLENRGYRVSTFTFAGNEPDNKRRVTYRDISASLERALKAEEKVTLVGHSSAGHIIQSAAPRYRERIDRIVFNNAWLLPDNTSQFDLIDPEVTGGMTAAAHSREDGSIPMDERFVRGILANEASAEIQDELLKQLVPQPLALMTTKIDAKPFLKAGFDTALLYCTKDISVPPGTFLDLFKALGENNRVVEIAGDHECLFTDPETWVEGLVQCLTP